MMHWFPVAATRFCTVKVWFVGNSVKIVACTQSLLTADKVTSVAENTLELPTANVCPTVPPGTKTLAGTTAMPLLLVRKTVTPPTGAGLLRVTVPVVPMPPMTAVGLTDKLER